MTMIPAFGPWTEHPADTDEEKRLASAQQSKTSPLSVDKEHETGVFYGSGKEPYQTSLASCTCNDFVKRKKPCKHIFRLAMELDVYKRQERSREAGPRHPARHRHRAPHPGADRRNGCKRSPHRRERRRTARHHRRR